MAQDRIRETLEGYERDIVSLRAINAELLAALKAARKTMALALDNMPWLTQRIIGTSVTELTPEAQAWCDTLNAAAKEARAAIEKAEAE